jgi:hypothetical protein
MVSGRKKDTTDPIMRFFRQTQVKESEITKLSNLQTIGLNKWFIKNTFRQTYDWISQLVIWLKLEVHDFVERRLRLEELGSQKLNLETSIIKYGEIDGPRRYFNWVEITNSKRRNRKDYWLNLGFTEDQAIIKISEYQSVLSKKGVQTKISQRGSMRAFSHCCVEFWEYNGFTTSEAKEIISKLQMRDLDYFINKYGHEEGVNKYEASKAKRAYTWDTKTELELQEHALKARPKTFNETGQEMQAINLFLEVNNINKTFCQYGAPVDQFYQWIPDIGFRRYDLAVYSDLTKSKLELVFEFHGIGHINFSEYEPLLANEKITINGKPLDFPRTYGASVSNDKIKRNHILQTFPEVQYIVMWSEDLKLKKAKIDELL